MRILLHWDNRAMRLGAAVSLRGAGHVVDGDWSGDWNGAIRMAQDYHHDAIVIEAEGPSVRRIADMRMRTKAPIIVFGQPNPEFAAKCLNAGADDYLPRPFHRDELLARLCAIVRRWNGFASSLIELGALHLDLDERTISLHGAYVHTTKKEFSILEALALANSRFVSREHLLDGLYFADEDPPDLKIIDVFICRLRAKIGADRINTLWGRGFRLRDPDASNDYGAARRGVPPSEGAAQTIYLEGSP